VLVSGELAALDGADVALDRVGHLPTDVAERPGERGGVLGEADDLVDEEDLALPVRTDIDTDGRDVDGVGPRLAVIGRAVFGHEREDAGGLVLRGGVDGPPAGLGVEMAIPRRQILMVYRPADLF